MKQKVLAGLMALSFFMGAHTSDARDLDAQERANIELWVERENKKYEEEKRKARHVAILGEDSMYSEAGNKKRAQEKKWAHQRKMRMKRDNFICYLFCYWWPIWLSAALIIIFITCAHFYED